MNPDPNKPWEQLLPPAGADQVPVRRTLRLLRRHGQPLLMLPAAAVAARQALNLYPAQSWKARMARQALSFLQMCQLPFGTETCELAFAADLPFTRFMFPPETAASETSFAILFGNPNVSGRRFVLPLFDGNGRPLRVIKAGVGQRAVELVQQEAAFIRKLTSERLHAPQLLAEFNGDGIAAVAFTYASGPTPSPQVTGPIPSILESWLQCERTVRFDELAVARRLAEHCPADELTRSAHRQLAAITCHPCIHHGDFAPWNLRVEPGTDRWQILDWERGESSGPPLWDWLHYTIQPLVLVRKASAAAILSHLEHFQQRPDVVHYTTRAGITSHFDALVLGYLLYCRDVIRQAEGMPTIRALTELVYTGKSRAGGNCPP